MNPWLGKKNPVTMGLIGLLVLAVAVAVAIIAPQLMLRAKTHDYGAQFANASGLKADDPVYVAGVPAGRVTAIKLSGAKVEVRFRLDSAQQLGSTTTASIKLATVLGRRYLSVEPSGPGALEHNDVIPLARTTVPFILDELGRRAQQAGQEVDLARIRTALDTVSQTLPKDPALLKAALNGVSGAANVVNDHNGQISQLLSGSQQLTAALLQQKDTFVALLGNSNVVLQAIADRRAVIRQMLTDVAHLTEAADTFLRNNTGELEAVLLNLRSITTTLQNNDKLLGEIVDKLGPTSRYMANLSGNGNWGDVASPAGPLPDNLLCVAGLLRGCR